jgi:cob(I)alamin adenosyltransferase
VRIYTKTGDRGETGLLDGSRVPKNDLRVTACGELDELSAVLGVVLAHLRDAKAAKLLREIQIDLFAIGARIADPVGRVSAKRAKAAIPPGRVRRLERAIDGDEARLSPLHAFVLPGGSRAGALLHLARTVCRRAERSLVALGRSAPVEARVLAYVNRLSDLLFVLARAENLRSGETERTW